MNKYKKGDNVFFQYEPFEEKFEEKFGEKFPQVKKLFEQNFVERKYPFKNDPVVDGRRDEGITPDAPQTKLERETETKHLAFIANKMLTGSRVLSKLKGVEGVEEEQKFIEEDLIRRKKCCCPYDATVQKVNWTPAMNLDYWSCPCKIDKPETGIGMCPAFKRSRAKNRCAWLFQQFCSRIFKHLMFFNTCLLKTLKNEPHLLTTPGSGDLRPFFGKPCANICLS